MISKRELKLQQKKFNELITADKSKLWIQLFTRSINELNSKFTLWLQEISSSTATSVTKSFNIQILTFIDYQLNNYRIELQELSENYKQFTQKVGSANTKQERESYILQFLQAYSTERKSEKQYRQALNRWLDVDAIREMYNSHVTTLEQYIEFTLRRIPRIALSVKYSDIEGKPFNPEDVTNLKLDKTFGYWYSYSANSNIQHACLFTLSTLIHHIPTLKNSIISTNTQHYIIRLASDLSQNVWLQCEAFRLLFFISQESIFTILDKRLDSTNKPLDDEIFFRRYVIEMLCRHKHEISLDKYIDLLKLDPSDYVRQGLANVLPFLSERCRNNCLEHLLRDQSTAVKLQSILSLNKLICENFNDNYNAQLFDRLRQDTSYTVKRCILSVLPSIMLSIKTDDKKHAFFKYTFEQLKSIDLNSNHPPLSRWIAVCREQLWSIYKNADVSELLSDLSQLDFTDSINIKNAACGESNLRSLSAFSQETYGWDIAQNKNRIKVTAANKFTFRLWRFLHEFLTPATDKRQFHNHLSARFYSGNIQVPSANLCEMSATKVPGEPLYIGEEGGWRPYLPTVDLALSSLDQGWPTKDVNIYTPDGITILKPPNALVKRIKAGIYLTRHFAKIANLRNWSSRSDSQPDQYLSELRKAGFEFEFKPYQYDEFGSYQNKKITQFFSFVPVSLVAFWRDAQEYFYSVYQNNLQQLSLFVTAVTVIFFSRHIRIIRLLRSTRKQIPLVIGGWGTRGKSGTERLKAALFNSLGLNVVSKSTGCEAMFLLGRGHRRLTELFLFRPYDKASIWEQAHITELSAKLSSDVMLWECMGLTPRYISILQQQWMRDDISTITNCYPDHEDLQGPAGIDIPQVMQRFVPKNAALITSEESMRPFLQSAAIKNKTQFSSVGWLEASLISQDVLSRFPYEEHPSNIALVLKLSELLDIPQTYAIKEMADRVIPDLGVLKKYPVSKINMHQIQFINGMSANERLATLNNWERMGLQNCNAVAQPDTWLCTLVNNRADRPARTKVFASLVANDLSADQHYLIGDGLNTLEQSLMEAWELRINKITDSSSSLMKQLEDVASHLRINNTQEDILSQLSKATTALNHRLNEQQLIKLYDSLQSGATPKYMAEVKGLPSLCDCFIRRIAHTTKFNALKSDISATPSSQTIDKFKELFRQCFQEQFIRVDDFHITGNALIKKITQHSPAGLIIQIMGLQNIKGTGLDFVYRWQTWEKTYALCKQLKGNDPQEALSAIRALNDIPDFGYLDEELVFTTLEEIKNSKVAQSEIFQAELISCKSNIKNNLEKLENEKEDSSTNFTQKLINWLEAFLDAGDAIRRRKVADQIYEDLVDSLISPSRAAFELKQLNRDQKGGWLKQKLSRKFK